MPKPPVNYSILKHERLTNMADHVNKLIQEGWLPLGGVCLVQGLAPSGNQEQHYVQAVIRARFYVPPQPEHAKLDVVK